MRRSLLFALCALALAGPLSAQTTTIRVQDIATGAPVNVGDDANDAIRTTLVGSTLLDGLETSVDGIEALITATNALLTSTNTKLDTLDTRVDSLETLVTATNAALSTIDGRVDGLETLVGATNTALTTIDGRVDGLEGQLTTLDGRVDGLETLVGTTNTTLTTIDGRVDGIEGLLTTIDGRVDGLETLVGTTNTTLTTIDGRVDGIEALLGTTNTNTGNAATSLGNLDDVLTPITPATATATKGLLLGAQYNSTPPTFTNGQQGALQVSSAGRLLTNSEVTSDGNVVASETTLGLAATSLDDIETAAELLATTVSSSRLNVNVATINGNTPTTDATADFDSAGGTVTRSMIGLMVAASGGGIALEGTAANGLEVDITRIQAGDTDIGNVDLEFAGSAAAVNIGLSSSVTQRTVPAQVEVCSTCRSLDLDESEEEFDTGAGELCSLWVTNTATTTRFIKIWDLTAANVTVGSTTPKITIGIPGNASDDVAGHLGTGNGCMAYTNALTLAATTAAADADTGAPAAGDVIVNAFIR